MPGHIEPHDNEYRGNKMVAAKPAFMPRTAAVPPGSAPVLPQLERHRRPWGSLQDFDKAAGAREQDAKTDQNPRPAGQAHAGSDERKSMNGKKQTRKPERGLEIELQRGRSRQERSP